MEEKSDPNVAGTSGNRMYPPQYQEQPPQYPSPPTIQVQPMPTLIQGAGVTYVHSGPTSGIAVQPGSVMVPVGSVVVVRPTLGHEPTQGQCRSCNAQVVTRVEYMPTGRTHLVAILLCLFGCWPCACLPYCMHTCQNAEHYCPNCGAFYGQSRF